MPFSLSSKCSSKYCNSSNWLLLVSTAVERAVNVAATTPAGIHVGAGASGSSAASSAQTVGSKQTAEALSGLTVDPVRAFNEAVPEQKLALPPSAEEGLVKCARGFQDDAERVVKQGRALEHIQEDTNLLNTVDSPGKSSQATQVLFHEVGA